MLNSKTERVLKNAIRVINRTYTDIGHCYQAEVDQVTDEITELLGELESMQKIRLRYTVTYVVGDEINVEWCNSVAQINKLLSDRQLTKSTVRVFDTQTASFIALRETKVVTVI